MRGRDQVTSIDVLPDDVLLAIFDFNVVGMIGKKRDIEAWQSLVHVCRRWRCLVFGSPRRLNLRLVCTTKTPVRECLDVWPALPLVIERTNSFTPADDIIVALEHSDRVCRIDLRIYWDLQRDKFLAAMQVPFPALTHLLLQCDDGSDPVIPDSFLGGSAPRLQSLRVERFAFPGIPNLLSSSTHLADLYLHWVSDSAYISPEAMATCLSMLTSLHTLSLKFMFHGSHPGRPPPMTRFILPELATISFAVPSKYLDDLVARIDAPQLAYLRINFRHEIDFDAPLAHLVQFISRTTRFRELNRAYVNLDPYAGIQLLEGDDWRVEFSCAEADPQASYIAQVCAMCLPPLLMVENLRLEVLEVLHHSELLWIDDVGTRNDEWLELLRPFTAVKNLYLSEDFQPKTASALQELVGGRTMDVLPSLQNIFLERSTPPQRFQETIRGFVTARQLSGHPIAISVWR